ncbi:MAG: tRNA 2-thiouridine(34) synthase MnmA [Oscillospiraceae bacterium]|nr:tRNA 2-thiouridine(34) synthase MnmA [Oscillospiraceae bacterium]
MSIDPANRVLVALSGGVDSSVCVYLLKKAGYDVGALVLRLSPCHESAVQAARQAAQALDIPLYVAQEEDWFTRQVIEPFNREYRRGRTPNPCVICNPTTKFAILCQKAKELGYGQVATGHYAGVEEKDGRYLLKKAGCLPRDQSYMLYRLSQEQLSMLALPLQALPKDEVRAIAAKAGLPCASSPDSQEICFVPDNDYPGYLERRFGPMPQGDFISPEGVPCGKHRGLLHYTVGQRKGLGIALGRPVFIRSISPETNRIYLADSGQEYARGVWLEDCRWIAFDRPEKPFPCGVKVRSVAREAAALVTPFPDGRALVEFETPQRALAPGQSAVCYDGDYVLGGGLIEKQLEEKPL